MVGFYGLDNRPDPTGRLSLQGRHDLRLIPAHDH